MWRQCRFSGLSLELLKPVCPLAWATVSAGKGTTELFCGAPRVIDVHERSNNAIMLPFDVGAWQTSRRQGWVIMATPDGAPLPVERL